MRIRSIRPEFWSSEDIAALDWSTRLVFIGLWSYVDDNGVGRDNERLITSALFPLEDNLSEASVRVHGALNHLKSGGQITRYMVGSKSYLHVTAFDTHQKINRPSEGRYPLPTCEDAVIAPEFSEPSVSPRVNAPLGEGEKGRRGEGEEETCSPAAPSSELAHLGSSRFDEFWSAYPRKVGKEAARKAWPKALKKAGHRQIITGAQQLGHDPNFEEQFCPHPSKWLNEGRWDDPPLPARKTGNGRPTATETAVGWLTAGQSLIDAYPDEPKELSP